jgi:RNA polymerase sigma factor (sigma-70 family)
MEPPPTNPTPPSLEALLARHSGLVASIVRQEAGITLLRFDSVDDLIQGARQDVVRSAATFEWRGEDAFRSWLAIITRRHLSARREYWFACKRNPGAMLRLTLSGPGGTIRSQLAASGAGPATFAQRREQLTLVTKAVAMLLPRDRDLVACIAQGNSTDEIAVKFGLTPEAAGKARLRALDRLRKAFLLLSQSAARQTEPHTPPDPGGGPAT